MWTAWGGQMGWSESVEVGGEMGWQKSIGIKGVH